MKGIKKALSYITNVEYAIMVVTFVDRRSCNVQYDLYGTFRNRSWSS